jgi:hypothetical protein
MLYGYFYRENPEKLFEVFLEVGKPTEENDGKIITGFISLNLDFCLVIIFLLKMHFIDLSLTFLSKFQFITYLKIQVLF